MPSPKSQPPKLATPGSLPNLVHCPVASKGATCARRISTTLPVGKKRPARRNRYGPYRMETLNGRRTREETRVECCLEEDRRPTLVRHDARNAKDATHAGVPSPGNERLGAAHIRELPPGRRLFRAPKIPARGGANGSSPRERSAAQGRPPNYQKR